ncbi:uncharacterized protein DEA37_0005879 [Paragonimus westermani]|uniref:Hexosyltransferase n=1 Tax=Paragonimus westermani TaxID=34504 RepID=A0A5J4NA93_9TREM|nr:uncharacterized protein DEA37_0009199 [Paragonimus westermani]KAA3671478.1 uncharacterized protein DEA37_0008580 [Paragonimus westermani]KAA3672377.1 uncharacterized protein DEA37_0005879 [Paragonimus westermani]
MGINVRTFFLLGELPPNQDILTVNYIQKSLEQENKIYGDLLQFDFVDHYNNNTYKLMAALQFAAEYCPQTRFVMIVDDDFLVHPMNLIKSLTQVTQTQYPRYVAGHVFPHSNPLRSPFSKWYVSYNDYPYSVYPRYPSGGSIIISMPVVKLLLVGMRFTRYLFIDDVFLGIVLHKLGISPMHLPEITIETQPDMKSMIAAHGFDNGHALLQGWVQLHLEQYCK